MCINYSYKIVISKLSAADHCGTGSHTPIFSKIATCIMNAYYVVLLIIYNYMFEVPLFNKFSLRNY